MPKSTISAEFCYWFQGLKETAILSVFYAASRLPAKDIDDHCIVWHSPRSKIKAANAKYGKFQRFYSRRAAKCWIRVALTFSIGIDAQLIGVKPIPNEWDWEPMRARIARQLTGDSIHVIDKCRSGNCGQLAILAHLKCEPEGTCVYAVSSEFRVRAKPLRIMQMNPVFAAVWSAPAYDYGIVKRDNIKHVLEIVDEVTSLFCLYYNQGRLMH